MKTYITLHDVSGKDLNPTIKFPSLPFMPEIPVVPMLNMQTAEASGKGVLLANERVDGVVIGAQDADGNPLTLTVTFRVEVSPRNPIDAKLVANKRKQTADGAALRAVKEENAQNRIAQVARETAVATAVQMQAGDAITQGVKAMITNNLAHAFGPKGLASGQ